MTSNKVTVAPERATFWVPPQLAGGRVLAFLGIAVLLNSFFAIMGSLLWNTTPYWPAYMISVLATAYLRGWGIVLSALSPIASSFLGMGDAPFYLYIVVNVVQMTLVFLAFKWRDIPPGLPGKRAKLEYLVFAILIPSAVGGTMAWLLRSLYPNVNDPPLLKYISVWTLENFLPALFPGMWLHKVIGEFYRPFDWEYGGKSKSWMRSTVEHSLPWIVSLTTVGVMLVLSVLRMISLNSAYSPGLEHPGFWARVSTDVVARIPGFPLTILALTVSFLCSLGYSIRFAKQAWVLSEAVRRHFPSRRISDLLLSGIAVPTEQRVVTIVMSDVLAFNTQIANLSPRQVVRWLNEYFAYVAEICFRRSGSVDKLLGDSMVMVFGLNTEGPSAREALRCVLDVLAGLDSLNKRLVATGLPSIELALSAHSGVVVAGEIGSPERRQYSIVGEAVTMCRRFESEARELPKDFHPVLVSGDCLREAGLLAVPEGFTELALALVPGEGPQKAFTIDKGQLEKCVKYVAQRRSSGAGPADASGINSPAPSPR